MAVVDLCGTKIGYQILDIQIRIGIRQAIRIAPIEDLIPGTPIGTDLHPDPVHFNISGGRKPLKIYEIGSANVSIRDDGRA